jgi:hypothetical protein
LRCVGTGKQKRINGLKSTLVWSAVALLALLTTRTLFRVSDFSSFDSVVQSAAVVNGRGVLPWLDLSRLRQGQQPVLNGSSPHVAPSPTALSCNPL